MCGILGFFSSDTLPSKKKFADALELLSHRGPDKRCIYQTSQGLLGHARLSIIDLSDRGLQPMVTDTGYVIVFNGEIYNYRAERKYLEQKGITFVTQTDTEVLLRGYISFGESYITRLNGMFSFVIYDPHRNILFAARDRFGKKPFYYTSSSKSFIFSSELKSLLPLLDKKPTISKSSVGEFLTVGYICSPSTIYSEISKLNPGTMLIVDLDSYKIIKKQYWDILNRHTPLDDARTLSLIEDAVNIRYEADVPVGIMLSGGLDSSAVLGLSAHRHPKTFTMASRYSEYDESEAAQKTALFYGCKNFCSEMQSTPKILNKLSEIFDEPFGDSSAIPTLSLSRIISNQGFRCALNGDGADEIFGGYDRYKFLLMYPWRFIRFFIPSNLPRFTYKSFFYSLFRLKTLLKEPSLDEAYALQNCINVNFQGKALNDYDHKDIILDRLHSINSPSLNKFLIYDLKYYLPDDLLVKMDRASMANSLEVRSPFLDYRLAEALVSVDFSKKIDLITNKKSMRRLFKQILPAHLFNAKKHGFQAPIDYWFINELAPLISTLPLSPIVRDFKWVDEFYIRKIIHEHFEKIRNRKFEIYLLLQLHLWVHKWLIN